MRCIQACGFLILFGACESSSNSTPNQAFDRGENLCSTADGLSTLSMQAPLQILASSIAADSAVGKMSVQQAVSSALMMSHRPSAAMMVSVFNRGHHVGQWSAASNNLVSADHYL